MVEARAPDGGATRCGEGRRGRDHEEEVLGHGHTLKKRSITDLFTAALAVDGPVAAEDEEEVQGDVRRRRRTSWNHRQRSSGSFRRGLDGACRPRQLGLEKKLVKLARWLASKFLRLHSFFFFKIKIS